MESMPILDTPVPEASPQEPSELCVKEVEAKVPIDREEKCKVLQDVFSAISSISSGFATIFLDDEDPLISVLPLNSDPFYIDQSLLHANIRVNDESLVEFTFLTPNREPYDIIYITDYAEQLPTLLQRLQSHSLSACQGFYSNDPRWDTLFLRLRKFDMDRSLTEKYNGKIIYRPRNCSYLFSKEPEDSPVSPMLSSQCEKCQEYLMELDKKYMNGKLFHELVPSSVDTVATDVAEAEGKKRRGRPKGSKNKSFLQTTIAQDGEIPMEEDLKFENDENDPSVLGTSVDDSGERVLVNSDDPDFIYGTEDIALEEDVADERKVSVQKGLKKRITTKRQKALLATKRKRGRPPIKVGPIDCSNCDKIFDNGKDYRKHCLEHINSFACSFGDCVKRFKLQKDLDIHLRKHRGEKPYVCTECDKAYAIKQDLRLHIRTQHTGKYIIPSFICK